MQITEAHVREILAQARLEPEDEQKVLALHYPADRDRVVAVFGSLGVTPDWLVSRLGGSP